MQGRLALAALILVSGPAPVAAQSGAGEGVQEALCRLIDGSAKERGVPVGFLTRLIWQESSFRTGATSSAGAQGVAQFMPGTAAERGLRDPFDPEQAIPAAASLLTDLRRRFGNWGLAAAAYNGGPARVQAWLGGRGGLPDETRAYVLSITGRAAEDWAAAEDGEAPGESAGEASCLQVAALLRRPGRGLDPGLPAAPIAPWGVQLAGNFSKDLALAAFRRAQSSYARVLGDVRPMIIGTRLRHRGSRAFYRVRVPAGDRREAEAICGRIRGAGGSCVVLPS